MAAFTVAEFGTFDFDKLFCMKKIVLAILALTFAADSE